MHLISRRLLIRLHRSLLSERRMLSVSMRLRQTHSLSASTTRSALSLPIVACEHTRAARQALAVALISEPLGDFGPLDNEMRCNMACCLPTKNCGRWQVYATTKATGAQYYRIYDCLCNLQRCAQITCDIVSAGDSDSSQASFVTNCGALVPLIKSSTL